MADNNSVLLNEITLNFILLAEKAIRIQQSASGESRCVRDDEIQSLIDRHEDINKVIQDS